MSSEIELENEDLVNVHLVRMEDIQPRERHTDIYEDEEVLETCIIDNTEYEECVVNDEDSNIGSMVSIQSEDVVECEDDDNAEMIVPEVLEPVDAIEIFKEEILKPKTELISPKSNRTDSWPTLEILPGGVIKHADKEDLINLYPNTESREVATEPRDMMYACAKCSQSFKHLFCLVKHVKWHEEEKKKLDRADRTNLTPLEIEMVKLKRSRNDLEKKYKKQKLDVFTRIARTMEKIEDIEEIFNFST